MRRRDASAPSLARRLLFVVMMTLVWAPMTDVTTAATMPVGAGAARNRQLSIDPAMLPADLGQSTLKVFVPGTGHSVSGIMLDYWRANGAASVYGNPISEPYEAPNGYFSQAFKRGVFQYMPEFQWTDDPTVRLQPIGASQFLKDRDVIRADGRRVAGDRRLVTTPASQDQQRLSEVQSEGGRTSTETGFSISGPFAAFYDANEGWFYLGSPITEPYLARGVQVQLYENALLLERDGTVLPAPLPRENPLAYGIDTSPIAQGNLPAYSEQLFIREPNPYGVDTTSLPGHRSIVVDISEQSLTAYQGDQVILQTPVSTGIAPNETEIGAFHVRIKFEQQDMEGITDASGEVVAVGDDGGEDEQETPVTGERYIVEDVPNVLYINFDAEALHGAYWHNNFGNRMSHGCINLPLNVAAFIFQWAPLGTAVTVRD